VLYPIDKKISLFSLFAFSKASLPHGYQLTGLWAWALRYSDWESIRRFEKSFEKEKTAKKIPKKRYFPNELP
jgi:hypothetical protein